jgi:UDP-N-acetylmuramate--alanine ligase
MNQYHFIGIGGVGLSALAHILLQQGHRVQGSDAVASYLIEDLKQAGASIVAEDDVTPFDDSTLVVYGTAIKTDHMEYQKALKQGLKLVHRSELLADMMKSLTPLLVAGTHGKTTTSALLSHLLIYAEKHPTYAVGGVLLNYATNGANGSGQHFVAEACESDGTFLNYPYFGAILTNLEQDHMDYWKSEEALFQGFKAFASKSSSKSHLYWYGDDPNLKSLNLEGISYGFNPDCSVKIKRWSQVGWKIFFDVEVQGQVYKAIELPLLGQHNVLNASAVFALGLNLGLEEDIIRKAFISFKGVKRRMEFRGSKQAVSLYDDYAHHPTEILATLKAAKSAVGERRLIVVFQPHRYSRTQDCWTEYLNAFELADILVVTDIYASGEDPIPHVTAERLFKEIKASSRTEIYLIKRTVIAEFCSGFLKPHDVVLTVGAGDINKLSEEILNKPIQPLAITFLSGGKSAENEVSHSSAEVLLKAIDKNLYTIKHLKISKDGQWTLDGKSREIKNVISDLQSSDICFPTLHGPFGEDGMIQGFLETLGIAYVGCDYRTAPVAMDKAWTKRIALTHGIVIADFIDFHAYEWENNATECLNRIEQRFTYPFFVKPVHLGSTFGVYRIHDQKQLHTALSHLCRLDYKFIVEEQVIGRELEFGFIGNHNLIISDPAEVVVQKGEIYTFEGKYGVDSAPALIKVPLPEKILQEGKKAAEVVYRALDCTGLARIDFFLKADGTWVLNEVNPMPGFTPTSVYPQFWPAEGIEREMLVDRLVIAGLNRKRYQDRRLKPPVL